jgi:hypothetical protein
MRAQGKLPSRETLFDFFHESVNDAGYACTLVWAVSHQSTDSGTNETLYGANDGQGYVFYYDGDGSRSVLAQYQYQQSRVSNLSDRIHVKVGVQVSYLSLILLFFAFYRMMLRRPRHCSLLAKTSLLPEVATPVPSTIHMASVGYIGWPASV